MSGARIVSVSWTSTTIINTKVKTEQRRTKTENNFTFILCCYLGGNLQHQNLPKLLSMTLVQAWMMVSVLEASEI
ncbi:hypothetical protein Hanom_Chr14g01305891 [Helianthus anomalus]